MNRLVAVILTIVLAVASATAGIRHYCNYTANTVFVTSSTSSSTSSSALIIENKRDYYGEDLVYRNDTLEMVLTDNGYVDAGGNYHYYVRDYQGNIRQVVDVQGNVIEQNDYYPYGGLFGESASRQSYKYSGKELDTMNGLNTYDFHARPYYYPTLQFHSPDLLSEKTPWLSPYLYCAGNPIMYIDPTGMETKEFVDERNDNNKVIADASEKYPENSDIQIFAHGDPNGIEVFVNGLKQRIENTDELVKFINEHFETGKNITNKSNVTIVLHSCKTGAGDNSFAENISEEMPNATIIAPNGYVVIGSVDGRMEVSKTKSSFDKKGEWRVFKQGEIVNTLPSDTKPNGDPGESLFRRIKNFIINIFE